MIPLEKVSVRILPSYCDNQTSLAPPAGVKTQTSLYINEYGSKFRETGRNTRNGVQGREEIVACDGKLPLPGKSFHARETGISSL